MGDLELPPNATITLTRLGDTEFFRVAVDGVRLPEIMHRGTDFFRAVSDHLHSTRVRREIDLGIF
jgi:hypothetical protein